MERVALTLHTCLCNNSEGYLTLLSRKTYYSVIEGLHFPRVELKEHFFMIFLVIIKLY